MENGQFQGLRCCFWGQFVTKGYALQPATSFFSDMGPHLPYPYSSDVKGTKYGLLRELRIQHKGKPYRILYAFDPRRTAILLIGGRKTGGTRWYEKHVPLAEKIFEEHLKSFENKQGDIS